MLECNYCENLIFDRETKNFYCNDTGFFIFNNIVKSFKPTGDSDFVKDNRIIGCKINNYPKRKKKIAWFMPHQKRQLTYLRTLKIKEHKFNCIYTFKCECQECNLIEEIVKTDNIIQFLCRHEGHYTWLIMTNKQDFDTSQEMMDYIFKEVIPKYGKHKDNEEEY